MDEEELANRFVDRMKNEGRIDEFCDTVEGDYEQCRVAVAKKIEETTASQQPPEQPPEPPAEPEQPQQGSMTVVGGEQEGVTDDIESIVADCIGKSRIIGVSRPNEHACKRAFEKQDRRIERLEQELDKR